MYTIAEVIQFLNEVTKDGHSMARVQVVWVGEFFTVFYTEED